MITYKKIMNNVPKWNEKQKRKLQKDFLPKYEAISSNKPNNIDELLDNKIAIFQENIKLDERLEILFNNLLSKDERDNYFDTVILNPYIPNVPYFTQAVSLLCGHENQLYGGSRGGGKALSLDTLVWTPNGKIAIEELDVGDVVYDNMGNESTIITKSDVFFDRDTYKLFFDDGSEVIASGDHVWVCKPNTKSKYDRYTTRQLHLEFSKDLIDEDKVRYANIQLCSPLPLKKLKDSDISPYLIGQWFSVGNNDGELVNSYSMEQLSHLGEFDYYSGDKVIIRELQDWVHNNIFDTRYPQIPLWIKRGSLEQREEFVRGIIDTDMTVDNETIRYRDVYRTGELNIFYLDDLHDILCSLGLQPYTRWYGSDKYSNRLKSTGEKRKLFNITFQKVDDREWSKISYIQRKKSKSVREKKIVNIKKIEPQPCVCIGINSPNHQFVIESGIVTHNSDSALMSALQYVDFPEWSVGVFRLTYKDLKSSGAILDRMEDWVFNNPLLEKEGIKPYYLKSDYRFTFPSGATIQFGQVQHDNDASNFQGAEFHKMVIDEAVQFSENKINRLSASIRKKKTDPLPTSILFTGNPGGISTEYFRDKFVKGDGNFIDSQYLDNCYLDFDDYEQRVFAELKDSDPVLYAQWKEGSWDTMYSGSLFKEEWIRKYDYINERIVRRVRSWDIAGTSIVDPVKSEDPDWTVGSLLLQGESGRVYVDNMVYLREEVDEVENLIISTAKLDGYNTDILIEREGGSQAKHWVTTLQRKLMGFPFKDFNPRKNKVERATTMVSPIKYGNLTFRNADWNKFMIEQLCLFPTKNVHDDVVDSLSLGFNELIGINPDKGNNTNSLSTLSNSTLDKFMNLNNKYGRRRH